MNVKINKDAHKYLCEQLYSEYLFGSQLHGIANEESDHDFIRVISDSFYKEFDTLAKHLPNIHSWQYDDEGIQYVWMTERQFYHNLFSGDGNMIADVVILNPTFRDKALFLTRTYKIIKGYLGVAKRDLKLHPHNLKKHFHAFRSLYMAKELMLGNLPTVEGIKALKNDIKLPSRDELTLLEAECRSLLNDLLNDGEIDMYPKFEERNPLVQIMTNTNNIREFKY